MYWPLMTLVAYAIAVHAGVSLGMPRIGVVALAAAALVLLLPRMKTWVGRTGAIVGVGGLACGVLAMRDTSALAIRLPPIMITAVMLLAFAGSLRRGATPLVTVIARRMGAESTPTHDRYTRQVTAAWVVFLSLLLLECILLGAFAPATIWSLFTNFINYAAIAAFFVGEYFVRRFKLPAVEHPRLLCFLRDLLRTDMSPERRTDHDGFG